MLRENQKERFIMTLRSSQECLDRLLNSQDVNYEEAINDIKETKRKLDASMKILKEVRTNDIDPSVFWDFLDSTLGNSGRKLVKLALDYQSETKNEKDIKSMVAVHTRVKW
jgi:hypothetical protein